MDFSQTLDELIHNAALLRECEEENRECTELESRQDHLLNTLLEMNLSQEKLQHGYGAIEQKITVLSNLNQKLLRPISKKTRFRRKQTEEKLFP